MLAVSALRRSNGDEVGEEDTEAFSEGLLGDDFFDGFDFSGIFDGLGAVDGEVMPELEVDPNKILAEFSGVGREALPVASPAGGGKLENGSHEERREKTVVWSNGEEGASGIPTSTSSSPVGGRGQKQEAVMPKGSHGKKKVKVDWTPDLHRRFVQAVEQLGVDRAVPSRILEIMGIDSLTRHNVASHLQKYRSHRKHLLAREAEAASWSQRRHINASRGGGCGGRAAGVIKKEISPWLPPTFAFPPPPPPPLMQPPFRPLHVWGHPSVDRRPLSPAAMWPRPTPLHSPAPQWPHQPPNIVPYCQTHYQGSSKECWGPSTLIAASPCQPQPFPAIRFASPPVSGIPPYPLYRPHHWIPPSKIKPPSLQPELNAHPSKESIDAAIEDVLAKPWLPLPLGLKPPSTESVMVELMRQGVSTVLPPACG